MSLVSINIKSLRKKHHYTQEQFAKKLGIKRSLLGAYEEARAKPRLDILVKAASLFNVSVDQLVAKDLSRHNGMSEVPHSSQKKTVEPPHQEATAMKFVAQQEQSSYFQKREDKHYLAALPEISLPVITSREGTYRAFEIADDAMPPALPGTIVVGKRQENLHEIEDGTVYIVTTRQEGILLRRVTNCIQKEGALHLHATNTSYEQVAVSVLGKEVEVWEAVCYISRKMPFDDVKPEAVATPDIPQLTAMIVALQQDVGKLKEEMRK